MVNNFWEVWGGPLQLGAYFEKVCCNVLPMNVTHVLLGYSWIYDKNTTNFGKDSTYVFSHNGKRIRLALAWLDDYNKDKRTTYKFSNCNQQPKQLHFFKSNYESETDSRESKIILTPVPQADNQLKTA